jgi:hypothetical protein
LAVDRDFLACIPTIQNPETTAVSAESGDRNIPSNLTAEPWFRQAGEVKVGALRRRFAVAEGDP